MAKSQDKGKKEKKKPKQEKAKKGLPPHLQQGRNDDGSLREIRRHVDDLAEKQKQSS